MWMEVIPIQFDIRMSQHLPEARWFFFLKKGGRKVIFGPNGNKQSTHLIGSKFLHEIKFYFCCQCQMFTFCHIE